MKVVSNTGPLIAFGKLARLDLLTSLFGSLMIPAEVQREVQVGVQIGYKHSLDIAAMIESGSIKVVSPEPAVISFGRSINLGEVGAIRLALQEKADLVLMDDRDARMEAERLGLQVTGTVGLVLAAIRKNLISDLEAIELLEAMKDRPDIWIAPKVIQSAISAIHARRK